MPSHPALLVFVALAVRPHSVERASALRETLAVSASVAPIVIRGLKLCSSGGPNSNREYRTCGHFLRHLTAPTVSIPNSILARKKTGAMVVRGTPAALSIVKRGSTEIKRVGH